MTHSETLLQYLQRVAKKDAAKGFSGWRSTREVAEFLSISTAAARRRLQALEACGDIAGIRDGAGFIWSAEPPSQTDNSTQS